MEKVIETRVSSTRKRLKTPRAAAIAGIVFALLYGVSLILIRYSIPSDHNAGSEWLGNSRLVGLALNIMPFAGIAFLWFIAVIRDRLGALEDRFFSTVFLGSGLLYIAMIFVSAALAGGLIRVLSNAPDSLTQTGTYTLGRAQIYQTMNVYGIKMAAVFMFSTSTVLAANGHCSALDRVAWLRSGHGATAEHWHHRVDPACISSMGVCDQCCHTA